MENETQEVQQEQQTQDEPTENQQEQAQEVTVYEVVTLSDAQALVSSVASDAAGLAVAGVQDAMSSAVGELQTVALDETQYNRIVTLEASQLTAFCVGLGLLSLLLGALVATAFTLHWRGSRG